MSKQNLIGPAIRRLRVKHDLTQDALAARCQVAGWDLSRETLSKIEAQLRRVNDAEVHMLAHVLRCEMRELFPSGVKATIPVLRHSRED